MRPACRLRACARPALPLPYQSVPSPSLPSSAFSLCSLSNAENDACCHQLCLRLHHRWRNKSNVTHLACTTRLRLAIQMQMRPRQRQDFVPGGFAHLIAVAFVPNITKDVQHDSRRMLTHVAQRQTRHRTCLLFKLAGDARVDGVMTTIVRAWSHLVDDQRAIRQYEELDAQHADIIELGDDRQRSVLCLLCNDIRNMIRRHGRGKQDAVTMNVLSN